MNYSITWVVNFSKEDYLKNNLDFLNNNWCKYTSANEIFSDLDRTNIASISDFFVNKSYKNLLHRFWNNNEQLNFDKFNLVVISDRENLFFASLFSYEFKKNKDLLVDIGLTANYFKNNYLIGFWEHSWSNIDYENNLNALYELSLFQNSIPLNRPFDMAFFYKNTNEGISNFGKYWESNDENFHASRCVHLILHLSTAKANSTINKDIERWCRSFGGLLIYNDSENIYEIQSSLTLKALLSALSKEEKGNWAIDYSKNKLDQVTAGFDSKNIFQEITSKSNTAETTEAPDFQDAWNWFSLNKLKFFFENILSYLLFNLKLNKIKFIEKTYKSLKDNIDNNLNNVLSESGSNKIISPEQIFDDYFKNKPFSMGALRSGVKDLMSIIESKRDELTRFYFSGYEIDGNIFLPFGLDENSKKEFDAISLQFKEQDDLKIIESEIQILDSFEKSSSLIPHPVSLLLKTFALSTVLVMLAFIPLKNLFDTTFVGYFSFYSILTILFIVPFIWFWNKYNKSIKELRDQIVKYEALLKYILLRRINQYIYRKVDNYFESYISKCSIYLSKIESFIKKSIINNNDSIIDNKLNSRPLFSVKPLSELVDEMPELKITIDEDGFGIKVSELEKSYENIYKFFSTMVHKNDITLSEILNNDNSVILKNISDNIQNTEGNTNHISQILFGSKINIKQEKLKELLDVIPPFNGISNEDIFNIESYSSFNGDKNIIENLSNFISPLNILNFKDHSDLDVVSKELNIVSFNSPLHGLKTLFSLNITNSYYEISKSYFNNNKERLDLIFDILYEDIVKFYGESLPEKFIDNQISELSFRQCNRGFDGGFDEDFENIKITFSKNFKEYNEGFINKKISKFLNKIYKNDDIIEE